MHLHRQNNIKPCHCFNNEKTCPFNELGCKFQHSVAEKCKFGKKCNRRLCPNKHEKTGNIESDIENGTDDTDNSEVFETKETDLDTMMTSTPKKRKVQCEECIDGQQCIDCYVRQDNLGNDSIFQMDH